MASLPHHGQCIELAQNVAPALERRQSFLTPAEQPVCRGAVIDTEKNGRPFDLILTDIQMPVMDGLGLVDALIERSISIPTVVITGNGEKDSVVEFMRRGCFDYLEKPLYPGAVIERVQAALDRALGAHGPSRQVGTQANADEELDAYRNNFFALEREIAEASNTCAEFLSVDTSACNAKLSLHRDPGSRGSSDFVDYRNRANGCEFFVADGMCNDLAAAYYAILFKAFFEENHRQKRPGIEFLRILNAQLLNRTLSRRQFNAAYLHVNLRTGMCELTGAGTPLIYHVRCGEVRARRVDIRGAMLGGARDGAFESRVFKMKPGDRLFFVNAGTSHDCDTVAQLIYHVAVAKNGALADTLDRAVTSLVSIEVPNPASR